MAIDVDKILVAVKGGKSGEESFRLACGIARAAKARLYALYVIEVGWELPVDAEVDPTEGENVLHRIEALGQEEKCYVEAQYIQARHAGPAIVQEALERGMELIVLGVPYKRRLGQFTLGSTVAYILKSAHCPIILWRERAVVPAGIGS